MEKETHVVKDSTQKNLALDPEKQKEFKKNNKKIKAKVVFLILNCYGPDKYTAWDDAEIQAIAYSVV